MDFPDPIGILFNRVNAIDPAKANGIIGQLLLRESNLYKLAFASDEEFKETVAKATAELLAAEAPSPTPSPSRAS